MNYLTSCLFMLLFIGFQHESQAQATKYVKIDTSLIGNNPAAGKYVSVRGFKMYYESYGSGQPVLLIHGNGGEISNMKYQVSFFAQQYKVIAADSRDQGKSKDPHDSISYEMMADDLNGLLDNLNLDSVYVIGWSDGGIEGLLLAMRHPGKVKKLAITGANLWPDTTAVDPWVVSTTAEYCKTLERDPKNVENKHKAKLTRLCVDEPNILARDLSKIKCPTLVIGGDHDVILPQHTMLIAQSIPNSYLWIVPDSGHSTPINYKNDFNRVVNDFFMKAYRNIEREARFN
ncbi:MAG: alpha/beta hydrolase [Saprospiraceae bacterium]